MTKKRAAGELVAATLAGLGVTEIFALHGSHLDPLYMACEEFGIRLTDTRHEAAAGHAADGYARSSNGKLGVCAITAGPGFTNALTAMANAYLDRIPTLFIAGAAPMREVEGNTLQGGFDSLAMARPVTKWAQRVAEPDRIVEFVRRAGEIALSGPPGPVFLEIPIDVMFWPTDEAPPETASWERPVPPAPRPDAVSKVLDMLRSAERPVIIAGGGVMLTDSGDRLRRLAELTSVPVIASQKALGVLPHDHPLYGGAAAGLAAAAASGDAADAVLLVGARMGMFLGGAMGAIVPQDAWVAQVEVNPEEIGRVRMADLPIIADAGATIDALLTAGQEQEWKERADWARKLRSFRSAARDGFADAPKEAGPSKIHPGHAVAAIMDILPEGTAVIADGGEAGNWVGDLVRSPGAGQHLRCGYLGCLGVSSGFAIGAARADPNRPVVCFAGDGGVGFNIQEFDTMVRHGLPIVTVVLNNSEWGMSRNAQNLLYGRDREVIVALDDTRYDIVASGFGVEARHIDRFEDIAGAVEEAFASGKPYCLNIATDPSIMHPRTKMMVGDSSGDDDVPIPYYANIKR
ncbi:thiamine pyrophosphate-binding protein [Pelagerythrobacter rhizovicinus]|uniref:Thiamine pyrophosphate-binding protein n=1 Tax=Pelagerythrobacter rhizovicinus TaxID=2268576 RepID=A0A4Q2KI41_9SPHN|nr:thiamine pyrophosphate-binding protein [Pelagerythrobacter rhizovicinus]RXZ64834.1 thiamine pyrophosphate-binding protein [Pelagerythrobacter rhizovicinus]